MIKEYHSITLLGNKYILKSDRRLTIDDLFWWLADIQDSLWGLDD
jgi:hypothetical protein